MSLLPTSKYKIFFFTEGSLGPYLIQLAPFLEVISILTSITMDLFFLLIEMKPHTMPSCVCFFFSLNTVSMTFIFVVLSIVYSFKKLLCDSPSSEYTRILKNLFCLWTFGFFPGLAVMNEAAMTIVVQVLLWTYVLISLGNKPRCGTAGSSRRGIFSFSKYCQTVFQSG